MNNLSAEEATRPPCQSTAVSRSSGAWPKPYLSIRKGKKKAAHTYLNLNFLLFLPQPAVIAAEHPTTSGCASKFIGTLGTPRP